MRDACQRWTIWIGTDTRIPPFFPWVIPPVDDGLHRHPRAAEPAEARSAWGGVDNENMLAIFWGRFYWPPGPFSALALSEFGEI